MSGQPDGAAIGVGATETLTARISAATLLRLVFRHPETQQMLLALEYIATMRSNSRVIDVKAKPFGGGVRILDACRLYQQLGSFHYDSQRSKEEEDLRLFIRPENVNDALRFCLDQFERKIDGVLETSPERELIEEIADTLGQMVSVQDFQITWLRAAVEASPVASSSPRALGRMTVRAYNIFQAEVLAPDLCAALLNSSQTISPGALEEMAVEDHARGGRGRANAVLALPWDRVRKMYRSLSSAAYGQDVNLDQHRLAGNVWNILDN